MKTDLKILAFDIETRPAEVLTFSLWKPFLTPEHVLKPSRMLCWTAVWVEHPDHRDRKVKFQSEHHSNRYTMLKELHDLLTEADVVITYNGKKFDMPWVMGEFILEGFPPLPKLQHIDLYQMIRQNSRYMSNKLDYVSGQLLGQRKVPHQGLSLWKGCMDGDEKSWRLMERYARQDTALLPKLWRVLRPYTTGANAVHAGVPNGCPSCGSTKKQSRGFYRTKASTFRRFQCQTCKHWYRSKHREDIAATRYL